MNGQPKKNGLIFWQGDQFLTPADEPLFTAVDASKKS
jgi:hypothetical protein